MSLLKANYKSAEEDEWVKMNRGAKEVDSRVDKFARKAIENDRLDSPIGKARHKIAVFDRVDLQTLGPSKSPPPPSKPAKAKSQGDKPSLIISSTMLRQGIDW